MQGAGFRVQGSGFDLRECLAARSAREGFLARVGAHVHLEVAVLRERLVADGALEGAVAGMAAGLGFRVQGSGFRVQGSGFRVWGLGFRGQGSGFRV